MLLRAFGIYSAPSWNAYLRFRRPISMLSDPEDTLKHAINSRRILLTPHKGTQTVMATRSKDPTNIRYHRLTVPYKRILVTQLFQTNPLQRVRCRTRDARFATYTRYRRVANRF